MTKSKKKKAKVKKSGKAVSKTKPSKIMMDPEIDATNISDGAMRDAFRDAFLRREI